jgi:NADH-quinone oxidoreductase subunit J
MSITDMILAALAVVFGAAGTYVVVPGAVGTYLMLPHRHGHTRPRILHGIGAIAASLGLLVYLSLFSPADRSLSGLFFSIFSIAAIVGGVLTVTSRNPIYCALWFASVVLSTSGLFLLAGAPFLAAGTVIVYAGAIIVTFLFVIMLAQMEGRADYDRAARSPGLATITCYLLFWSLIYSLAAIRPAPAPAGDTATEQGRLFAERLLLRPNDLLSYHHTMAPRVVMVLDRALTQTSQIREPSTTEPTGPAAVGRASIVTPVDLSHAVEKPNVAGLGTSLYTDHLVTVGLAGALLFVALIGAVAMTNPRQPDRTSHNPAPTRASP